MSGKSTYLKQIGLLVVQAMTGSFIPADYATIRLHDVLLSRLSNEDSIERSLSTFAAEIASISMILGNTTSRSLVLLDELGRGTAPQEGIGLSYAIAEELVRTQSFVFFATHYSDLGIALDPLPGVVRLYLAVDRGSQTDGSFSTIYKYKVVDDANEAEHYGLHLAGLASLPDQVMTRATAVATRLSLQETTGRAANPANTVAMRRKALLRLRGRLQQIANNSIMADSDLGKYLRNIQTEAIRSLSKVIQA